MQNKPITSVTISGPTHIHTYTQTLGFLLLSAGPVYFSLLLTVKMNKFCFKALQMGRVLNSA